MNEQDHQIIADLIPTECPRCGYSGIQSVLGVTPVHQGLDKNSFTVSFVVCDTICEHCLHPSSYFVTLNGFGNPDNASLIVPLRRYQVNFSKEISELSPSFVKTYDQAQIAESLKLDSIAGMGYRKALEMLVTDYAMKYLKVSKSDAESLPLSTLIKKIPDTSIMQTALAGAWIGNDETHYFRKNPEFGINQLKAWLSAFIKYVEMQQQIRAATTLIDSSKKHKKKN